MKCGQKVKYYREAIGMSQEELAKRTGYSGRSAVSRIESGERGLSQSKIKLFAHVLGVSPIDLIDDRDPIRTQINYINVQERIDKEKMLEFVEHLPAEDLPTYRALLELPIERLRAIVDLLQ